MGQDIQLHAAGGEDLPPRLALAAAQQGAGLGEQLRLGEGLGHVVVGPQSVAPQAVLLRRPGGEEEDGDVPLPAQLLAQAEAVHVRQHHVQNDQIHRLAPRQQQPLGPVGGGEEAPLSAALGGKVVANQFPQGRFVLHQQNRVHRASLLSEDSIQDGCVFFVTK